MSHNYEDNTPGYACLRAAAPNSYSVRPAGDGVTITKFKGWIQISVDPSAFDSLPAYRVAPAIDPGMNRDRVVATFIMDAGKDLGFIGVMTSLMAQTSPFLAVRTNNPTSFPATAFSIHEGGYYKGGISVDSICYTTGSIPKIDGTTGFDIVVPAQFQEEASALTGGEVPIGLTVYIKEG